MILMAIDWSATAAWIALAISIVGTIASPIITSIITNRHQLKLRELEIKKQEADQREANRMNALNAFISNVGEYIANPTPENMQATGKVFHNVYAYVPQKLWPKLDELYNFLIIEEFGMSKSIYAFLTHEIALLLTGAHQENQKE